MRNVSFAILAVLAILAIVTLACDSNDPVGPDGTPAVADGVAVDTFIVMRHANGIHLVDPATGKTSPGVPAYYTAPISAIDDGFAISPDGQRIAWIKELGTVAVGEAKLVAGEPVLEIVAEYPNVTSQGVKWSPDGDRLVTTTAVIEPKRSGGLAQDMGGAGDSPAPIDPASDTIWVCPDDDATGNPIVLSETLVVFPGSHRYVCPDGLGIYDDGVFVGRAGYEAAVTTADGQLYGLDLHMPSASRDMTEVASDVLWNRGDLPHFMLPDGKTLIPPGGANDDGYVYDLPAIYQSRAWARSASDRWFMVEALDPFLHESDAANIEPLALQDNGRAVVFRVTTLTEDGFPPELIETDSTVVEVTREGTSRGFITSPLMDDESFVRLTDTVFDLVGDDFLAAGWTPKDNGQEPHLVGYVDGQETHYRGFDTLTPDGRWLYGFRRYTPNPNEGGQHCFYDRKGGKTTCFPQVTQGSPIGFMGQGVKAGYDAEPPAISGVSRTAAWPGADVVVFGAHFGRSGTLTLGGTTVQTVSWSPNQIRFRMPSTGTGGVLVVSNGNGKSGFRDFHVGVSKLIETPFSGMTRSEVSVGQGINVLDLGAVALDDEAFVAVGQQYAYHSLGASPTRTVDVTLHADGATRALRVHEGDGSADAGKWQIVASDVVTPDRDPRLADVGGLLVETNQGRVPVLVGERVVVASIDPRIFFGGGDERGLPDFWRNDPVAGADVSPSAAAAAWTASLFDANTNVPWSLRRLTSWEATAFGYRPVYAETPRATLPAGHRGVAGSGQVVVTTGSAGSYQLSSDGGLTFAPHEAGTTSSLREPLLVAAPTPFFLVLEAESAAAGVKVHAIGLDGTFTSDVQPALPNATLSRPFEDKSLFAPATWGGKIALLFGLSHELRLADCAGAAGWTTLADVRSIYQEGADLYAVMLDGSVRRSSDWKTFAPFDLAFDLAIPLRVQPLTIAKLDGRWLVLANLFDGAAPSALMPAGYLLGPEAP